MQPCGTHLRSRIVSPSTHSSPRSVGRWVVSVPSGQVGVHCSDLAIGGDVIFTPPCSFCMENY